MMSFNVQVPPAHAGGACHDPGAHRWHRPPLPPRSSTFSSLTSSDELKFNMDWTFSSWLRWRTTQIAHTSMFLRLAKEHLLTRCLNYERKNQKKSCSQWKWGNKNDKFSKKWRRETVVMSWKVTKSKTSPILGAEGALEPQIFILPANQNLHKQMKKKL